MGRLGSSTDGLAFTELVRTDVAWSAGTGAASAGMFATVLTNHPGLGDAPETVAGVMSLGILHAPGYPAYVLAARAFSWLVPVGDAALRVNLFSLICASLTVAGVQLLARRYGAPRWAASLAALVLAATAGFWFYSGYAKHDMFSGLLFLVGLHLCLSCAEKPSARGLLWLGVVIGLGFGSSWPLMSLLLPSVAFALWVSRCRISLQAVASAGFAALIVVVCIYGFVMVRAAQSPPVNWGGATTLSRLTSLVQRSDFQPSARSGPSGSAGNGSAAPAGQGGRSVARSVLSYGVMFSKELGVFGVVLAALGAYATLRRRTSRAFLLLITFVINLVGVAAVAGVGSSTDFSTDLIQEGFVLGCYFVLAVWLGLGAGQLGGFVRSRRLVKAPTQRRVLESGLAIIMGGTLLVPSISHHWAVAHRASKPFADRYARSLFAELPPRAVVFIWGAELTQPLVYRQVVYHERPDVVVVAADGLSYDWYRRQLSRRLARSLPPAVSNSVVDAASVIRSQLSGVRPVYLDPQATEVLAGTLGSTATGLLARPLLGNTRALAASPTMLASRVAMAERVAGLPDRDWNVWPNDYLEQATYSTAAFRVARGYFGERDFTQMGRWLSNVLSIEPGNTTAQNDLAALRG